MNRISSFDRVLNSQNISIAQQVQHWIKYEIFSLQFWFLIIVLILPWVIWWKVADKKKIFEILVYGLLISIVATLIDEVGCQLNWWDYRYDIEPLFPRMTPVNYTLVPVCYMIVYQYFPKWKSFIAANIIFAAGFAFIGEPLMHMWGIYVLLKWKYIYSFPIYIILAVVFKLLINLILKVQKRMPYK